MNLWSESEFLRSFNSDSDIRGFSGLKTLECFNFNPENPVNPENPDSDKKYHELTK
jgi:hypothetical protein